MAIKSLPRRTSYPGRRTQQRRKGQVVDEVGVEERNPQEGDYRKLIQLIKWDDGEEFVRFGYYVKDHGSAERKWRWGSQTTMQLPRSLAKEFVRKAEAKGIL